MYVYYVYIYIYNSYIYIYTYIHTYASCLYPHMSLVFQRQAARRGAAEQ